MAATFVRMCMTDFYAAMPALPYWTNASRLGNHNSAAVGPDVYAMGTCPNAVFPGPGVSDLIFGVGWPANFMHVYVGISELQAPQSSGMRKRLSAHSRGKGSKRMLPNF